MSSTSREGGESITLLLFSSLSLLLLAATAAASLKGTYVYCIRDERHNNLPLHTHTTAHSLSSSRQNKGLVVQFMIRWTEVICVYLFVCMCLYAHYQVHINLSLFLWLPSSLLSRLYLHLSVASPWLPDCLTGHVMSLSHKSPHY